MSERKPCIRCARQIDAYARVCPYCNWDQTVNAPPPEETPPVELYRPPDNQWKKIILAGVGFVSLVIIAFVVGSLAHGFDTTEAKAAQARNGTTTNSTAAIDENPTPPKNVTLVPMTGTDTTEPMIEQPVTSAPSTSTAQQPSDTTALPSQQYAAAAARAKAQQRQQAQQGEQITDPRALTGAPYHEPPAQTAERTPEQAPPGQAAGVATSAFPEYKPLPRLSFDHEMTARLTVSVSADGRVTDIEVNEPVPQMGAVIAAVQNWRFRPATVNGTPVPARVAVDILFHGNG